MSPRNDLNVSVIIPTFNREHTIGRAIQSVLAQTLQDFEIIVVDDGSTDGTQLVVEEFQDPRIVYIRHDGNRRAAAARNTGINAAKGRYLAFLDSDDEWFPEKLAEQIALLDDPSHGYDVCCSAFVFSDSGIERPFIQRPTSSWFKQLQWDCDLSPGTTLVVRRECLPSIGLLDEAFLVFEDWDWLLRLSRAHKLAVVAKPVARVYRSQLPPADVVEVSTRRFVMKHDRDFRSFGWFYRRRVVSRHWLRLASCFYGERRFARGNRFLVKAFIENPLHNMLFVLFGLPLSLADASLGTSFVTWTIAQKRRWIERQQPVAG